MEQNTKDVFFMQQAIMEARKALPKGEVPIGSVVVSGDRIVGRGYNMVESLADATAHAEMQAITSASSTIGGKYLNNATLYVTLEPCVMCAGACGWSQMGRIVWGAADPKRGFMNHGGKALLHPKTEITGGVMESECTELLNTFFDSIRR